MKFYKSFTFYLKTCVEVQKEYIGHGAQNSCGQLCNYRTEILLLIKLFNVEMNFTSLICLISLLFVA